MTEKVTDPRIKEFTDYFFKIYEEQYKRKPMWSGKEAKLLQAMLKSFDSRGLGIDKLYRALGNFFEDQKFAKLNAHAFAIFAVNPDKYLVTPEQHGANMIVKAKEVFNIDQILKVQDYTEQGLLDGLKEVFKTKDEESCRRWVKGHKYWLETADLKEGTPGYEKWQKNGRIAKMYFGAEMVVRIWKEDVVSKEEHMNKVKKQSQIILTHNK